MEVEYIGRGKKNDNFLHAFKQRANAQNVRLYYLYWQYTDHFIISICISALPTQHTKFIKL